jgi:hypothetical protein
MEASSGGGKGPEGAVTPQKEWNVSTILAVWLCTMRGKEEMGKPYTATEMRWLRAVQRCALYCDQQNGYTIKVKVKYPITGP